MQAQGPASSPLLCLGTKASRGRKRSFQEHRIERKHPIYEKASKYFFPEKESNPLVLVACPGALFVFAGAEGACPSLLALPGALCE